MKGLNRRGFIYIAWVLYLIIVVVFVLFFVYPYLTDYSRGYSKGEINEKLVLNVCSGLDLFETTKCLNDFVKKTFFYNKSKVKEISYPVEFNNVGDRYYVVNVDKDIRVDDIFSGGGVCRDYSQLYYKLARKLGFNAKIFVVDVDFGLLHSFVVIYDSSGYCLPSQTKIYCVKYSKEML